MPPLAFAPSTDRSGPGGAPSLPVLLPLLTALAAATLIGADLAAISLALSFTLPGLLGFGRAVSYGLLAVSLGASAYVTGAFFRQGFAIERAVAAGIPPVV
jgi:hypothetical protein